MRSIVRITALLMLCGILIVPVFGAEVETLYNQEYCFGEQVLDQSVGGIFVRSVPEESVGIFCLGNRRICPGDVLDADRLCQLRLIPKCEENAVAVLTYSPILGRDLGEEAQFVVKIRSGKNEAPKAENLELETYKNIANNGKLTATDPEGSTVEFILGEQPKYGKVELKPDGNFLYIPGKNKVGEDSFTFVARDEAGNESLPGTVKIKIMKPSQARTYADMEENPAAFEAMWAESQKLTGGMDIAGQNCFQPDGYVTRGEFLAMVMELTDQPVDQTLEVSAFLDSGEAAAWLRPYMAAAVRAGVIRGELREDGLVFRPNDPIRGREAAVMLQNVLKFPVSASVTESSEPCWSAASVQALRESGLTVSAGEPLTRENAVCLLYAVSKSIG